MNILCNSSIAFNYAGLFFSDGQWIHPDRVEETYEIIYVTGGEVYLHDEALGELVLKKGNLVILEPYKRHFGFKKSCNVSFYWVHFHIPKGTLPFDKRLFSKIDSPHLFKELLHYACLPEKPEYLINSILIRILCEVCYLAKDTNPAADKTAEEIYEWIRINANAKLSAKSIAEHFGFSADHITRIMKKSYGIGTKAVIDMFILLKAKELLANTGKYIKEIAYELNFESDKAFIGFFKYHEGVFPSDFRSKFYKIHMNNK